MGIVTPSLPPAGNGRAFHSTLYFSREKVRATFPLNRTLDGQYRTTTPLFFQKYLNMILRLYENHLSGIQVGSMLKIYSWGGVWWEECSFTCRRIGIIFLRRKKMPLDQNIEPKPFSKSNLLSLRHLSLSPGVIFSTKPQIRFSLTIVIRSLSSFPWPVHSSSKSISYSSYSLIIIRWRVNHLRWDWKSSTLFGEMLNKILWRYFSIFPLRGLAGQVLNLAQGIEID